ncbi:hypothetical protein [Aeromonas sobria]|uniref:hypothetical protein n=1 Tax=Aeromonas sobria TaxID=646 RepID=UPI0011DF0A72|nr:hypothetical protein [Aeromonas sobria]HEH9426724.1 hypothetical protein [Aeromonas sobria]
MATQGDDQQGVRVVPRGGAQWKPLYPGFIPKKYQDGEIRGLSIGKNGVAGYQGFIKMAVWLDVNLLFLNGF